MATDKFPLLIFRDVLTFEAWLATQSADGLGAWLKFAKKGAPEVTLSKSDAIDCALAHGWIDGQLGRVDEHFFKTRFTPRKPKSAWSQVNRERVERLLATGRMTPRSEAQVNQAKADGRWANAYAPSGQAKPDADLQSALDGEPAARAFFDALDAANRYAVLYRVHQARTPEKRTAKITELVAKLSRGEALYPRRSRRS
jgi:uncharacterized protein YdeI (YjbR/CyaY-like superfamily)